MTAARERQGESRGLLLQIDSDLQAIRQLRQTIENIENGHSRHTGKNPDVGNQMGLALCLHHIYTAIEIFTRINKIFDEVPLTSGNWYRELLRNMAMKVENIRPAVISAHTAEMIDEYRAFRHVVRHAYDYKFDWSRLEKLIVKVPEVVDLFCDDVEVFKKFVKQTIEHLNSNS